jgi:hypothetical protein
MPNSNVGLLTAVCAGSVQSCNPSTCVPTSDTAAAAAAVAAAVRQVFYKLLAGRCSSAGPGGLVADVGANFGWHALLSAYLGCR